MKMIFEIAWKNVWRNKLRSLIVIVAITIGLIGGLFYIAFVKGMTQTQIDSTIRSEVSNIQIHNPKFLINDETRYGIENTEEIVNKISEMENVQSVSTRLISLGMVSSAATGAAIILHGIDADYEKMTTDIHNNLIDGTYFETNLRNPIIIGEKLASKLKVRIGSKVVITLQDMDENLTYGAFKVAGIFKTDDTNFDQIHSFVQKENLSSLINYNNSDATEIAIRLTHNEFTENVAEQIKNIFSEKIAQKEITVRTWKQIRPILEMLNNMTIQFTMIFVIIILVALSFAIINTMLMAIMERVREIGMLMAIGMSKVKVFLMIMLETVFLSLTGGFFGLLISWIVVQATFKIGIDLSTFGEGLNAYGYSSFVRPELELFYYIMIGGLVMITAMLASILPARKALKLKPSEAVRQDV
jgi:putative ABC transport system permease protein